MRHRGIHVGLLVAFAVAGCGRSEPARSKHLTAGTAKVGGEVVSTVDGEPIRVRDVERVVRETGLAPEVALRRLQRGLLLAREARRRGYGDRYAVRLAVRKAEVQALLARAVEDAVPPSSISDEEVRRAFDEHRDQLENPDFDRMREQIRDHLLALARHRRLVELVDQLERRYGVTRHPERLDATSVLSSRAGEGAR